MEKLLHMGFYILVNFLKLLVHLLPDFARVSHIVLSLELYKLKLHQFLVTGYCIRARKSLLQQDEKSLEASRDRVDRVRWAWRRYGALPGPTRPLGTGRRNGICHETNKLNLVFEMHPFVSGGADAFSRIVE